MLAACLLTGSVCVLPGWEVVWHQWVSLLPWLSTSACLVCLVAKPNQTVTDWIGRSTWTTSGPGRCWFPGTWSFFWSQPCWAGPAPGYCHRRLWWGWRQRKVYQVSSLEVQLSRRRRAVERERDCILGRMGGLLKVLNAELKFTNKIPHQSLRRSGPGGSSAAPCWLCALPNCLPGVLWCPVGETRPASSSRKGLQTAAAIWGRSEWRWGPFWLGETSRQEGDKPWKNQPCWLYRMIFQRQHTVRNFNGRRKCR